MNPLKHGILFLFVPLLALFFSCSARIDGVVREGGAADLTLSTSLEPRTQTLISSLRDFMGGAANGPILDGPAMASSMAAAPGVKAVSLKNTGPSALEGTISISDVGNFLSAETANSSSPDGVRFISYTEGRTAGTSSITITLNRDSAPDLVSRLSPEVNDYLSALMAPAVTGDICSSKEYLDLVASVYGRPLADEINTARIRASVEFPRPVSAVRGGNAAGKRVDFEVPLVDILVLEQPLLYTVSW